MVIIKVDIRDAFFNEIYQIAKSDKNVIFITDDLDAWGLVQFKKNLPKQFINIGVAEQNMIDLAAGLATCGKKVFVYGICSYVTTRCFEQIKFSVCSMNLPVVIVGIGAGFSFSFDGPSHHGTVDVAVMRTLPEMTILNPSDSFSAGESAYFAYQKNSPCYIRLDKGFFPKIYTKKTDISKGYKIINDLSDINVISTGYMTQKVIEVIEKIRNVKIGIIDLLQLKPINVNFLNEVIKKSKKLITIEENSLMGGIGTIVSELIAISGKNFEFKKLAVQDKQFDIFGSREWLLSKNGLDSKSLYKKLVQFVSF